MDEELAVLAFRARFLASLVVATTGTTSLSATSSGFAREEGSFIEDGFAVGLEVKPAGFDVTGNNAYGVVTSVSALALRVAGGRTAEDADTGRSIVAGIPEGRAWENVEFTPVAGRPYLMDAFIPATSQLWTVPADGGQVEETGLYKLYYFGLAGTGEAGVRRFLNAVKPYFTPGTGMGVLEDGTSVRVNTNPGPWAGAITQVTGGRAYQVLTVPYKARRVNTVINLGVPGAPTITGITSGNGQLSVAFSEAASNGSTISAYQYRIDGGSWITASSSISPIVITGLTNGTEYDVELRAVNGIGSGAEGNLMAGTPYTTAGAPSIVSVTPGDQQLSVAFSAPGSNGGSAITDYEYRLGTGAWVSVGSTSSPFVISGLDNGTAYSVTLRAVNAAGSGTASGSSSGTPRTVPDAPTIGVVTPGNTQLSVAFTLGGNGGSAITSVEYRIDGAGSWTALAGTTSPQVIAGLSNGVEYDVELRAVNAAGNSAASNSVSGTPRTVPSAPTIDSIDVGDTQISVNFTAGANGGAAITDYERQLDGGAWVSMSGDVTTPLVITGLTNGVAYAVRIRAVNAAGAGAQSNQVSATPSSGFLLGALPGALAAFAFFDLASGQTGNSVDVIRESDNATASIPRSGGWIDEVALAAHCAGTNGYICKAYDPTGNGNHLTSPTSSESTLIYTAGATVRADGVIGAVVSAIERLTKSGAGASLGSHSLMVIVRPTGSSFQGAAHWGGALVTGENSTVGRVDTAAAWGGGQNQITPASANNAIPNNAWALLTKTYNHGTGTARVYVSDVEVASGPFTFTASDGAIGWMTYADTGALHQTGHHALVGFWPRVLSPTEISSAKSIASAALGISL